MLLLLLDIHDDNVNGSGKCNELILQGEQTMDWQPANNSPLESRLITIIDILGIEAVYPGWSEGRGPSLRVQHLVQHLPWLDRVWGALARGRVCLKV